MLSEIPVTHPTPSIVIAPGMLFVTSANSANKKAKELPPMTGIKAKIKVTEKIGDHSENPTKAAPIVTIVACRTPTMALVIIDS